MIDFLLTFIGIVFSRLFYRWANELISRNRSEKKRVIIYGAGDSGYLLLKELLQNHRHELTPIGWIDDDTAKHNMFLNGYKIYGGKDQLSNVCSKIKPDMVLISTTAIDEATECFVKGILAKQNISLGRFSMTLAMIE
jgi:UDP-GlcNAc:undecaprenyl-phosphate GlcNAc-1-phosphate transferase